MAATDPTEVSTAPQPATSRPAPGAVPARARGVELLGAVAGSGYRRAPSLVRRADGQMLQLTPVLYAVLAAVDGRRDAAAVARHLREAHHLEVDPADIDRLVEDKLRPLGVLRGADGEEPEVARSNPLLALRWRYVISDPSRTRRLAAPFTGLLRGGVVAAVLVAFVASTAWVLLVEGLAGATRDALYRPGLLLAVVGLTAVSAAFHELGHAAACLRAGGPPGAMGAGLYLVWPAFYTDVSDSYRLPRADRLRVDLGGLYFNAVFSVLVVAASLATGAEALLVLVPLQLLQMLRQLVPLVRFDGYHVLADLTGVPDLFARIRPTLAGLLPWRWGDPDTRVLKPWARAVVTAWVLAVVPLLALSLVLLVVATPRLLATTWDSLGAQVQTAHQMWAAARPVHTVLALISIAVVALPALGITHLITRLTGRTARRLWTGSAGNPPRRAAVVLGGLALALLLARAWWPDGQYEPIDRHDRGTLVEGLQGLTAAATAPFFDASESADELGSAAAAASDDVEARAGDGAWRPASPSASAPTGTPERARFTFTPPDRPGPGDNQALVVNYEDGSSQAAYAPSLDWVTDGSPVRSTNQAYALASCVDCRSVAVAFQVVLVVGQHDDVVPRNEAVAVNHTCSACTTRSLAMQTVLVLEAPPTDEQRAAFDALWARVEAVRASVGPASLTEVWIDLAALQSELIALLGADVAASDEAVDTDHTPATSEDGGAATTTTTVEQGDAGSSTTDTPPTTTTTNPPSTTTTEPPPTTTTTTTEPTEPAPTESPPPSDTSP